MKTKMTTPSAPVVSTDHQTDSTKLVSLLALAAGAVAMPQTGNADIIYTDASAVVVGYGGVASFEFSLPGTARFGFQRRQSITTTLTQTFPVTFRSVLAGDFGGVAAASVRGTLANGFAAPGAFGATWSQGAGTWNYVTVGAASNQGRRPSSGYDHLYLAWVFEDSSIGGSPLRYGWVDISLSIGNVTANPASGPNVRIWGYAYDNSGLKPTMGQVPEPTSMSLLVLGALALGARGVRSWRRDRNAACKA